MLVVITSGTGLVTVGEGTYPTSSLFFKVNANNVSIWTLAGLQVSNFQNYAYYANGDSGNVPYGTLAALIADLKTKLF